MNGEKYKHIIDEAYENYRNHFLGYDDVPTKDVFVFECKTDKEFSERWGLKIEERNLSNDEVVRYFYENVDTTTKYKKINDEYFYFAEDLDIWFQHSTSDIFFGMRPDCPKKIIIVTYKENKTEVYE